MSWNCLSVKMIVSYTWGEKSTYVKVCVEVCVCRIARLCVNVKCKWLCRLFAFLSCKGAEQLCNCGRCNASVQSNCDLLTINLFFHFCTKCWRLLDKFGTSHPHDTLNNFIVKGPTKKLLPGECAIIPSCCAYNARELDCEHP